MFKTKMLQLVIAMLLLSAIPGCVSKSTFEEMAGQAHKLDSELNDLQSRHQALQTQQTELQASHTDLQNRQSELQAKYESLTGEKNKLEEEKRDLLAQKEALTASNRELEGILAAKEDSLSKKIAAQRQELAAQQTDYNGRLGEQSRQLANQAEKITALDEQIRQKSAQIAELEKQLARAEASNSKLGEDLRLLRQEKESEVQQMTSTYQSLLDKMKSEIDNGQITISELKGKLTVNMVDAILFDSGKAEVKPEGLLVLQRVIDILKGVTGKTIRIEGHTDNVQIIGLLAQKYPTNWELSAARAVNVARFLQERGIDPQHLNAVAYGEYKPVADNSSETGRAKNRRIEIILVDRE